MNSQAAHTSVGSVFAISALLTALIYLLAFQLSPDAPMRTGGNPPPGLVRQTKLLSEVENVVRSAAGNQNIAYGVAALPNLWAASGTLFTAIYFSTVYSQYPQRVIVGDDRAIINFPVDMQHANQLQSDAWLRERGVRSVVTLLPSDSTGPQFLIHLVR